LLSLFWPRSQLIPSYISGYFIIAGKIELNTDVHP